MNVISGLFASPLARVAAFVVWTVLVCSGTFRATFPSDVVADRIRYEVPIRLGRTWSAEVGSVAPWWLGVSIDDVKLFQESTTPRGPIIPEEENPDGDAPPLPEAGPHLAAALSNVSLRLSPWSIIARAPYVRGSLAFGDRVVYTSVGTTIGQRGEVHLEDLAVDGEVPLAELLALAGGSAGAEGALDLDVDLAGGEFGMKDSSGRMKISGAKLKLTDVDVPGFGPLSLDIDDLKLVTDVVSGKATVTDGKIVSSLATIAISGDITLRDPIDRSAYDLQFVITDLSEDLAAVQGMLASAKQTDGSFLYSCRGTIGRPTSSGCSSRPRTATARPPSTTRPTSASTSSMSDEERERKREEIREKLRKDREARLAGGTPAPGGTTPPAEPVGEEDGGNADEGPPEPPPEEEGPPPDEEDPVE